MSHLSPEFNAEVFPAELEEIASRREQLGLPTASLGKTLSTDNGLVGLSLSGGGIRSAVFSLGVIQGLAKYGLLKRVDYLSTVSGGGYIGSCISSLLNDPENRPENEKFPLRLSGGTSETAALTHLRNSSNYLSPGGLLEKLRIPNVLLRGIVLNLLVFLPGIMAAVVVTGAVFEFIPRWDYLAHFVLWLILGFAVLAVTFSIAVKTFRRHFGWHRRNLFELVLTIPLLVAGLLLALIPLLEIVRFAIEHNVAQIDEFLRGLGLRFWWTVSFVLLAVLAVFMTAGKASQHIAKWRAKLVMLLIGLMGPAIIFLIYGVLCLWQIDSPFMPIDSARVLNQSISCQSAPCMPEDDDITLIAEAERQYASMPDSDLPDRFRKIFGPYRGMESTADFITELRGRTIEFYPDAVVICQSAQRDSEAIPPPVSCDTSQDWSSARSNPPVWLIIDGWKDGPDALPDGTDLMTVCPPLAELRSGIAFDSTFSQEAAWVNQNCTYFSQHSAQSLSIDGARLSFFESPRTYIFLVILFIIWVFNRMLLDINVTSPHGFYRDRLSKAFLFRARDSDILANDNIKLQHLNAAGTAAPYHILNAALNMQGSNEVDLRGRMSDFFIFSKRYIGSDRTGYVDTREIERFDHHLNLGTACAISAAAAAPNMGTITNRSMIFILTVLNIRLGYWLPNPKVVKRRRWNRRFRLSGAKPSLIWSEAIGALDAKGSHVNVSDGGHLENLGIYPLLKRRCKFIIAIDGEADPNHVFNGLVSTMRLARIDMGIEFDLDLEGIRKSSESDLSTDHVSVGTINYGHGEEGTLLYIKLSVTGDEPEYVRAYRTRNQAFPYESTADQFFSEEQFEAYRALGEHISKHCIGDREGLGPFAELLDKD